jgi:protein-S-isoprenylcysteine O-methyltransferase Ste14
MATQKLLTDGPYAICRNPMVLGALTYFLSVAILTSSFKAVLAVVIFGMGLVAYLKWIEEKELSLRFGEDYVRYRASTPFIIPRFSRSKKSEEAGK